MEFGSEPIELGSEPIELGSETIDLGSETIDLGSETIKLSSEAIELGSEPIEAMELGSETIDSSTPFRSRAAECLSMEERFCMFKVNIESTVTALKAKLSEQTHIIAESKQELCKLASDNLHLRTHLAELEEKVSPKANLLF
jgi:hypothetical protein